MNVFVLVIISLSVFGLAVVAMAVGVILGGKRISGSCGGLANQTDEHGNTACSLCSNPDDACKELAQRMRARQSETPAPVESQQ